MHLLLAQVVQKVIPPFYISVGNVCSCFDYHKVLETDRYSQVTDAVSVYPGKSEYNPMSLPTIYCVLRGATFPAFLNSEDKMSSTFHVQLCHWSSSFL